MRRLIVFLLIIFSLPACVRVPNRIEPVIQTPPHPKEIHRERRGFCHLPPDFSVSPFPPLAPEEGSTDWGKEFYLALCFAADFDLFRAITGFKRALWLLPPEYSARRLEIEYDIALAYFLGGKFVEAAYSVESTDLINVDASFPAFDDLLLLLYESYHQIGKPEHATHIFSLIDKAEPEKAGKLNLLSAVKGADFEALYAIAEKEECRNYLNHVLAGYQKESKSIRKAQWLNALLPGAGYWYVGQRSTAVTAFLVNSLFITAATQFFLHGNEAAGIITISLEGGWYFGGIIGAGHAAKFYNEQLYCTFAHKITQRESYFPLMMLQFTF